MKKLQLSINVSELKKDKIIERKYKNKEGNEVTIKEFKLDVVPLKEEKLIFAGDNYKVMKVGFVTYAPTKEERTNKVKMPIIGDALETRFEEKVEQTIKPDEIPF